jgi:hypothetical protein
LVSIELSWLKFQVGVNTQWAPCLVRMKKLEIVLVESRDWTLLGIMQALTSVCDSLRLVLHLVFVLVLWKLELETWKLDQKGSMEFKFQV